MARKVDDFPAGTDISRYPWDDWLDGSIWELSHGDDFKGRPNTFRSNARTQAKKRGGKLKARVVREPDNPNQPDRVYLQFLRRNSM